MGIQVRLQGLCSTHGAQRAGLPCSGSSWMQAELCHGPWRLFLASPPFSPMQGLCLIPAALPSPVPKAAQVPSPELCFAPVLVSSLAVAEMSCGCCGCVPRSRQLCHPRSQPVLTAAANFSTDLDSLLFSPILPQFVLLGC